MAWLNIDDLRKRISLTDPRGIHSDDRPLQECLNLAEGFIESHTGRKVLSASYTRRFDGNGLSTLFLPVIPVTAVSSVLFGTTAVTVGTPTAYHASTVSIYYTSDRLIYPTGTFTSGFANIRVAWTAGYTLATVPHELHALGVAIAALAWKERDRWGDQGRSMETFRLDYTRDLPPTEKQTLYTYTDWRRLRIDPGVDV